MAGCSRGYRSGSRGKSTSSKIVRERSGSIVRAEADSPLLIGRLIL
ncbi:hypothetical protein [Lysobacter gummosus]